MIETDKKQQKSIRFVKYFSDLQIINAMGKHFSCGIKHNRQRCQSERYSLEMIRRGKVKLHLDNTTLVLEAPCVFWIGDRHSFFQYELMDETPYEHLWVDFFGLRGRRIYESLCDAYPEGLLSLPEPLTVGSSFDELISVYQIEKGACLDKMAFLLEKIMFQLAQNARQQQLLIPDDPYRILRIGEQIRQNPFQKYDFTKLAMELGISHIYFRILFKEKFGLSIGQYMQNCRMEKAAVLLQTRRFRISELSDYCGFPDITSFSRAFKNHYHQSPRNWLKSR